MPDVFRALEVPRPDHETRLALAVLGSTLNLRDDVIRVLAPVYEAAEGEAVPATALAARADADRVVARHLYGLEAAPQGGYRLHQGDLLDPMAYERVRAAERVAALQARAGTLLETFEKQAAFKKLEKLRVLRTELDKARRYALLAIFNETHYPYPYNRASKSYQAVQKEVDRRVALVRAIWLQGAQVRIKRSGRLAKLFETWEATLGELRGLGADVAPLEQKAWVHTAYATGDALTIQTFFTSPRERRRLAYSAWVQEAYNPARTEVAVAAERNQVAITNAYRDMMGFTAVVKPGPGRYQDITDDTVRQILDEGEIVAIKPIHAVRIDGRLVTAARAHSHDMTMRGYFGHHAPPNPRTGEGTTGPEHRTARAGYTGWGISENIARCGSAQAAHDGWCHSSGHHRNILSSWEDLGVGHESGRWTQNFGSGGGASVRIEEDTQVRERGQRAPPRQIPR